MFSPRTLSSIQGEGDIQYMVIEMISIIRIIRMIKRIMMIKMIKMITMNMESCYIIKEMILVSAQISFPHSWRWFVKMVLNSRKTSRRIKLYNYICSCILLDTPPDRRKFLNQQFFTLQCFICTNKMIIFSPRVFVNSIFEIEANHTLPETKTELIEWVSLSLSLLLPKSSPLN